jgi:hypothetical protein
MVSTRILVEPVGLFSSSRFPGKSVSAPILFPFHFLKYYERADHL